MSRRLLTPAGGACAFAVIALLVVGGLAWVTVASLRVEEAERQAAARADAANTERLALWQLDGRLFPALGVENNRPYAHYFALSLQPSVVLDEAGEPVDGPARVPSPLLSAELPDWMLLHFQLDPDTGWESPQVVRPSLADKLRGPADNLSALPNATPARRELLAKLRGQFPVRETHAELLRLEAADPTDSPLAVPLYAGNTAMPNDMATELKAKEAEPQFRFAVPAPAAAPPTPGGPSGPGGGLSNLTQQSRGLTPGVAQQSPSSRGAVGGRGAAESNFDGNNYAQRRNTLERALPQPQAPPTGNAMPTAPPAPDGGAGVTLAPAEKSAGGGAFAPSGGFGGPAGFAPGGLSAPAAPAAAARVSPETAARGAKPLDMMKKADAPSHAAGGPDRVDAAGEGGGAAAPLKRPEPMAHDVVRARQQAAVHLQPPAVHLGPLRPHWLTAADGSHTLALVRAARLEKKVVFQGVVLDWPRLQEMLKEEVRPVLPAAALEPAFDLDEVSERRMAAIPAVLDPGPPPLPPPAGWTPLRSGLALAWAAALLALAVVGAGGRALIDLSERRIRFVSAVTHELRTPLTSLRLYLDLLASGMVREEEKQKEYLDTLNTEADRLNRLIENVLDFARLEKRSVQTHRQPTKLAALLGQVRETWADRCAADGKELVVVSTLPPDQELDTDVRMAGQVLGNLIDNAKKYSRDADDRRIWLWAKPGGRRVILEVEDRGPGVPVAERCRVFRPFRRGPGADTTAGGAGLGLALAKQWAEALGGRLTCRAADGGVGACFRLELPVK